MNYKRIEDIANVLQFDREKFKQLTEKYDLDTLCLSCFLWYDWCNYRYEKGIMKNQLYVY